jgi:RNA polymerase sigma factor (sigma-70 family)
MTQAPDDKELVRTYVSQGCDTAFRGLVARHVDLVYGTALRQTGDRGIAEEITQNVFVALARKAPRLGGVETLAGWLYRTTILEAKARIRAELRHRRREERAVELATIEHDGCSPLDEIAPLLDEGLLHLRENDRVALALRFFENRSLREVGMALGVDQDAARKRVARALERLSHFFRNRGFSAPSAASAATLLAAAAKGAPAGLALTVSNAASASGASASGLNLLLFHLMALTKTQTAALCLLIAAVPLAWQHHAEARVDAARAAVMLQLASDNRTADALKAEAERNRTALSKAQSEAQNAEVRLAEVTAQLTDERARPVYQWNDNSSLMRLSKAFLGQLSLSAVSGHRGQLNEQIKEVLRMSEGEQEAVQGALNRFVTTFNTAQSLTMQQVPAENGELQGHTPEETRVFKISALGEQLDELRCQLFLDAETALGAERFQLFKKALQDWMPLDNEYRGMNSGMAVFNFDHRVAFYKPQPGTSWLEWQIRKLNGEMMRYSVEADDIPPVFTPHMQDWTTLAKSSPLIKTDAAK